MIKVVLIAGISGQDGTILSKKLSKKGYKVIGLSRKKRFSNFSEIILKTKYDKKNLIKIIKKFRPKIIFNFAGESNPKTSWEDPLKDQDSITRINLNLINAILETNKKIKYFHASTSEIFGMSKKKINEKTFYSPNNPYGCFKLSAHLALKLYREKYNLFLVNGILFNHESEIRSKNFLIPKIINHAKDIKKGAKKNLVLETPFPIRDFAHADDTINAIYKIMNLKKPSDFIISGGNIFTVRKLAETIFKKFKISKRKIFYRSYNRKNDIMIGDSSKLKKITKWKPKYAGKIFIEKLIDDYNF
tara:strand:- start:4329 stop:5237 length:909 start_codon:yes stop_codon:yes gene_type:complete